MKKIVLLTLVLMTLIFGLASCSDGSAAGVGDGSDKSLFVGKWKGPMIGLEGTYREYKSNGTWQDHGLSGAIVSEGTWNFGTYEGRSVFVEHTNPSSSDLYPTDWFYDYEFNNDGNELHLRWLGNAGGNKVIPNGGNYYLILTKIK